MNKQIKALLLSVLMILNVLVTAVPALAAGGEPNVAFTVSVTEAQRGDTFTVTISSVEMTVLGFSGGIMFDKAVLECTAITGMRTNSKGETVAGIYIKDADLEDWHKMEASTVENANSYDDSANPGMGAVGIAIGSSEETTYLAADALVTVTFKVKDDAPAGETGIIIYEQTDGTDAYDAKGGFETKKVNITVPHVCAPTAVAAVAATCETAGNIAYYECDCGKYYEDAEAVTEITDKESVVIPKLGHDWDEGVVTTEPTETAKGVKTFTCKNDASHTKTEEIPELGHQCKLHLTAVAAKDADCENAGNKAYYKCECGKYFEDADAVTEITDKASVVIPKLGHDWDEGVVTTEPTETAKGVKTFTCNNDASHTKTEEIPELGHQCKLHLTAVAAVAATCETDGNIAYYECECGKYFEDADAVTEITDKASVVIPATGHDWDEGVVTTEPTETVKGVKTFTCNNDASHTKTEEIPELGHQCKLHLTAVAAVEATCETDGNIAYYECECGKYFEDADAVTEITDKASVVIPATGHDWDEGTVTTEPGEETKGEKTYTCKNDASHTKTEEIPELGHQCKLHLTAVEAKEADCETAGNIAHYVCECGKYYADSEAETELSEEDVIIDAGHAWSEWTETTAPTCTDKGEETRICTKECGVDPETREIPALGHAWGEWITTLEPTVEAKGEERRDCDRCDAYETRELAQLEDDSFMEDWYWTMIMLHNQIFEIEADASEGGTITPDGIAKVHFARDAKYIITPDEGYEIEAVYVDGVDVGAADTYTFKRVTKDHSIYAVFAEVEEDIEAPAIEESLYDDVDADDWFYDDVVYVTENGLMNGTGDDIFSPEVNTTRAMIVTILWRLEGEADAESAGFTDVADDMWYTEAIDWAAANGIVNGFGDGTFGPEKAITREQVMAILHRYAAYKGWDDGMAVSMIAQYDCSVWAENDVNWADMNGILADLGVDVYDMTAEADRAEIAAYFTRFCLNVAE